MRHYSDLIMIRHAESEVNVDIPVRRYEEADLTVAGRRQAMELATRWPNRPPLCSTSPFRAARATAQLLRLPGQGEPTVDPGLAEFRYLDSDFADGSTRAQRQERSRRYWYRNDPRFRDGGDAESFEDLAERVEAVLCDDSRHSAAVVTHGMFVAAAQVMVARRGTTLQGLFDQFVAVVRLHGVVANCSVTQLPAARSLSA